MDVCLTKEHFFVENLARFSRFVGKSMILPQKYFFKLTKLLLQLPRKKSTQISNTPNL
jgi:hypothetical protein